MFILRRVHAEYGEINTNLGDYYTLISKEKNLNQFNDTVKLWEKDVIESVYGVVVYEDGENTMPLYNKGEYYIMTSDGRTFSNISDK